MKLGTAAHAKNLLQVRENIANNRPVQTDPIAEAVQTLPLLLAGQRWVYGAQLTVQDATVELTLLLYDAGGRFFGGFAPRDLAADADATAALRRTMAALQNDVPEPRC